MTQEFSPPYTPLAAREAALAERGFALLHPLAVRDWMQATDEDLATLHGAWSNLPPDEFLKDGGHYRRRRHSCFVVDGEQVLQVPHRAHWQPLSYNALHGGMHRWFEAIEPATVALPLWSTILTRLGQAVSSLQGEQRWYVEAHPFRIDTTDGIGRPTPEGAHRDGVDLVAVFMIERHGIKGGESRVFEANGPAGQRFTLREPWSLLLLDDSRVIHETTPIQPLDADMLGWRDTLVLTYRRDGFQEDPGVAARA